SAGCTCTQPSSGNLVKNAGFDKDLASWTLDPGAATFTWEPGTFMTGSDAAGDADACPYSGSIYVSNGGNSTSQNFWQCVAIATNTSYNFGARIATLSGGEASCSVDIYQGPGCTGPVQTNVASVQWLNVNWPGVELSANFNSSFDVSAKVYCYV